jgi:signal peptide peptidase SppA
MRIDPTEPLVLLTEYLPLCQQDAKQSPDIAPTLSEQAYCCGSGEFIASDQQRTSARVAIVPLWGMLTKVGGFGTSLDAFAQRLDQLDAMDDVVGIVVHTKSPGGTVAGTRQAADALDRVTRGGKTKTATYVDGMMASGALWIGAHSKKVITSQYGDHIGDTAIGSIGVVSIYQEASEAMQNAGVKTHVIRVPEMKARFNGIEPLTDEMRQLIQERNTQTYNDFLSVVNRTRGIPKAEVETRFGRGEMVSPAVAVEQGLADQVGTLQDAIHAVSGTRYRSRSAHAAAQINLASADCPDLS